MHRSDFVINKTLVELVEDVPEVEQLGRDLSTTPPPTKRTKQRAKLTPKNAATSSNAMRRSPSKTPTKPTISQILMQLRSPKRQLKRRNFSHEEVSIMQRNFAEYLRCGRLPPMIECDNIVDTHPTIFVNRRGRDLYNWVQYKRNRH